MIRKQQLQPGTSAVRTDDDESAVRAQRATQILQEEQRITRVLDHVDRQHDIGSEPSGQIGRGPLPELNRVTGAMGDRITRWIASAQIGRRPPRPQRAQQRPVPASDVEHTRRLTAHHRRDPA